jgi:hypothetical protein
MIKCGNCGAMLTCGCQRKTLPNGKSGCSKCPSKPPVEKENNTVPIVNSVNVTK